MPRQAITAGDGDLVLDFVRHYGKITKDSIAGPTGQPLPIQHWQEELIRHVFARDPITGRRRARIAWASMGRKNGKTGLMAPIAVYELTLGGQGGEIYSCAADRDQAKLMHTAAKRTVEMNADLAAECRIYRDAIEHVPSGSVYRAVSSEAYTKEGLSPSLVLADELHAWPTRDLYDVMALAMGARRDPLMLIVTTAGVRFDQTGGDSIAYTLYQYGKRVAAGEIDDPTMFMAAWEAPADLGLEDKRAWRAANPGYGSILDPEELAAQARKAVTGGMAESEFRIKRLSQWVSSNRAWLPTGAWEACADPQRIVDPSEPIVLGFDGSWTNDSTALVGCTVLDPHIFVINAWERPIDNPHWRVDSDEVDRALRSAVNEYNVVEIAADPHQWRSELSSWLADGLPVTEWFTNALARMVPACKEFYTAVTERTISHDGDPRLARHLANATIKEDRFGVRITKETRGSPRKIDLAVASIIAFDRAKYHEPEPVAPAVRFYI